MSEHARIELIEAQLRDVRQLYSDVVENAAFGIFRSTPGGRYLNVNRAMSDMLGYTSPEELIASVQDISRQVYVDPTARDAFVRRVAKEGVVRNFECQAYRKDGTKIWLCSTLRAVSRDGVVVEYHGMNEDITQRKSLEDELRGTQKMDALGHFAVNVAHEFNNMLNVISGYAELLQNKLPSGKNRNYAAEISKAAFRAAALTSQLLVFSRKQQVHPVLLDLNGSIRKWHGMMTPLLGKNIALTLNLSSDLWWVKVDPGQIDQILMNLAINAGDAMPRGGNLLIETINVELDEIHSGEKTSVEPGSYVMLSFGDTGCGMDADTRAQIFEPFFTTKPPGKGTGLGLSTVFGIVKQNSGHIVVHSEPQRGTTFRIYFPRGEEARQSRGAGAGASNNFRND